MKWISQDFSDFGFFHDGIIDGDIAVRIIIFRASGLPTLKIGRNAVNGALGGVASNSVL